MCVCRKTVEINIWILILIVIDLLTGARAFNWPAKETRLPAQSKQVRVRGEGGTQTAAKLMSY